MTASDLVARYRDALRTWASTRNSQIREGERTLKAVEEEILAGHDLGDGIDPVMMTAMSLPGWLASKGVDRRLDQIRAASGDGTADWVLGKTVFEHQRQTAIFTARADLLDSTNKIIGSINQAEDALKVMERNFDPGLTEASRRLFGSAFDQMRLLAFGAQTIAPNPKPEV